MSYDTQSKLQFVRCYSLWASYDTETYTLALFSAGHAILNLLAQIAKQFSLPADIAQ